MSTTASPPTPAFLQRAEQQHFIDGRWQPSASGETLPTVNPSTGETLARLARGRQEDVNAAVAAARRAFEGPWSRFTPHQRHALMLKVCELIERHFDELALLESLDMGAPISRTRAMKNTLLQSILYFASQALNWSGSTIPNSLAGRHTTLTLKAPAGVVGAIIPWNAPLVSMWWSMGGVLATGCTAVIKTAEDASLSTLRSAELLVEAGVPPGVVNVVTGLGAEAGAALAAHGDVDRVMFTGSTTTGREIIKASVGNIKRIQLELGGKSPDIVFDDADLDKAVPGAALGVFNNSGQICSAGTRILVQRGIHREFVERLVAYTKGLRVGPALDPASQLGPLVSGRQVDRVLGYVDIGRGEGAALAVGGTRLGGALAAGYFVTPAVFDGVRNDMRIAREEIFGPVACVIPFDGVDDALRLANDTDYGLGGAAWTQNVSTMMRMMHGIRAGKLWINCYGLADPAVGFSGVGQSGYGVKGGAQHVENFLVEKSVYINHD